MNEEKENENNMNAVWFYLFAVLLLTTVVEVVLPIIYNAHIIIKKIKQGTKALIEDAVRCLLF